MRVHYIQHAEFEGLAAIEPWLRASGHTITGTQLFADETLPRASQFDWLIVMGGPMGVNDVAEHPWLPAEKHLIRQAIEEEKVVLGVCLGAQLIAGASGAKVYKNPHREIGWFEIVRTPEAADHPLGRLFPEQVEVFHWHGDTFDLPAGAVRLASSKACLNQAFSIGTNVLALQFHLETTPESAGQLIDNCGSELMPGPFVQAPTELVGRQSQFDTINRLMADLLDGLAQSQS
jgi:GMP synthase (glutamine-hydrolysing)